MFYDQKGGWLDTARYGLQAAIYPLQLAVNSPSAAWNWLEESFTTRETLRKELDEVRGQLREQQLITLRQAETTEASILPHSPSGKVPALKDGDLTVWDSLAICEYLAERLPNATRETGEPVHAGVGLGEVFLEADPAKAKRMLESFNRFLRASLASTRSETTTLAAERELIASFLDVLQVRMGSRLRYRVDLSPGLEAVELPPMLLQPLVENAIRHGLEPKVEGGEVAVAIAREHGHLLVRIEDSGVGFAPTTRGGLGLTNVRDRLRLLYGERAALVIGERDGGGTVVMVRMPA